MESAIESVLTFVSTFKTKLILPFFSFFSKCWVPKNLMWHSESATHKISISLFCSLPILNFKVGACAPSLWRREHSLSHNYVQQWIIGYIFCRSPIWLCLLKITWGRGVFRQTLCMIPTESNVDLLCNIGRWSQRVGPKIEFVYRSKFLNPVNFNDVVWKI